MFQKRARLFSVIIYMMAFMMAGCSNQLPEVSDTREITLEESIKESQAESEKQDSLYFFPQTDSSLLTDEEKDELENAALTAAGQAKKVYETVELLVGPFRYLSNTIEQKELELPPIARVKKEVVWY